MQFSLRWTKFIIVDRRSKWECINLNDIKPLKIQRLRAKYGASITALACLYSVVVSWGENWFFTVLFGLGVVVCGLMSYFDIKSTLKKSY